MNVGFTYEIRDKTNPDLVYYGSSELSTLDDRMKHHLQNFNNWKNNNNNGYCSSYKILELNNYKAEMIKIVFFTIKWELREQERKLIENNECVNHNIPNRTNAEYYQANREQLKEINKEWREANKEHIKELNKEYLYPGLDRWELQDQLEDLPTEELKKIKSNQLLYPWVLRDVIKDRA